MRLHIEYSYALDPVSWQQRYDAGLVPGRLPYGLDHLNECGFDLLARPAAPEPLRLLERVSRRLTGGFEFAQAARHLARRTCDVALCWDERTGVPASLRSRLPGEPVTAMGVIWITEPDAPIGRRGWFLARHAVRRAGAVWAMSPPQLDVLAEWGVERKRLHLLHMGIDVDFWRTDREVESELVVGAGNDRHRDHPLLIEAMGRLRRRRPSLRLELVSHHPVTVPSGLGRRHGSFTHPEMRDLYGRASVVALALKPNLHLSGLSVLLEAMACSRPVVVTASPGITEYVEDGVTGVIVSSRDPDALAAGVEELLADPARARTLGVAARTSIERYSTQAQSEEMAAILRSCS